MESKRGMEIGRVDLSGMVSGGGRGAAGGWEAARAAVTASVQAHGCVVVAAHDALGEELRRAMFARATPELVALPLEVKMRAVSTKSQYGGYTDGKASGMARGECLRVDDCTDAASVRGLVELLWPDGNQDFCETIVSFSKNLRKLVEVVETLILEGLGVRAESIGAHLLEGECYARLWHYDAAVLPAPELVETTASGMSLPEHYDNSLITAVVQHEVGGLEVHVGDGRWVTVPPEPGTVVIVVGEPFRVATNGRVPACLHRVRSSNRVRFSACLHREQKDGVVVRVLDDLVDDAHPRLYNPIRTDHFFNWRYSEEGLKYDDPLKAYCGAAAAEPKP